MPGTRNSGGHARSARAKKSSAESILTDRTDDITPPEGMAKDALVYWHYFAPLQVKRQLLTLTGRFLLRRYCQIQAHFDRVMAAADLSEVVMIASIVDSAGRETIKAENNPLGARIVQLSQQLRSLENDLLLSPAAAIRMPAKPEGEEPSTAAHDFYGDKPKAPATRGARLN